MKVLFVSQYDHRDIHAWSGTVYYLNKTLKNLGCEIYYADDLSINIFFKFIGKIINKLTKKKFIIERENVVLKSYARQIKKKSQNINFDLVFSTSSLPITYLKTEKPIFFFTDATFNSMLNYYDEFTNLSNRTIRSGTKNEERALRNSNAAIFASKWAEDSAMKFYNVDNNKVFDLNFGINIENTINLSQLQFIVKNRNENRNELRLLFIGVDWVRKGGELALKTAKEINNKGIKCRLFIIGCNPHIEDSDKKYTEVVGFLNKNNPKESERLDMYLKKSHFLFMPTRREAFGLVFAEASSYGLPSISTDTGGVFSVISNGKNGYILPMYANEKEYANKIIKLYADKFIYSKLCFNSYNEYIDRLNWNVVGENLKNIFLSLPN
ncbi:MAG: glycosyltransferase family 4 protein [Clostridium sp.]|nr:glycosyltransferase family 4 protein [Clostridium sp.]